MSPEKKRKREREREEQERRERLAYVGVLAQKLMHELRNPLHVIVMNVQLLEEEAGTLPDDHRERFEKSIGRLGSEMQRLVKTLEEFLTYARPPQLDPSPTDINHVLREVVEFSEAEFRQAGIEIHVDLADDMYPVILDYGQFTHVMLNLFRNARQACESLHGDDTTGEGGRVNVRTDEREETIAVIVEDNGPGIEPGAEEEIFELFYTTKKDGTGLGLGIARRILEEHGGTLTAENRPEGGARFIATLPRGKFLEFNDEA